MVLFLIASGLSLIFGVTRVVNFAHGSFYMLAAYLAYTLAGALPLGGASFYVAVALAALAVARSAHWWRSCCCGACTARPSSTSCC